MANTNIDILDLQGLGTYDTKIKTEIGKKADDFVPIEYSEWLELTDAQKNEHNWKLLHVPDSGPEPPDVPDGKTVTPTDDVATWLECAGIDPTGFSTLSDVLADSVTLQALMEDNNAVDYLVRSTSFAKSEALVPVMTSDTTPSGTVLFGTEASSYEGYKAFDGNSTTYYASSSDQSSGQYIGYDFGTATTVGRIDITPFSNGSTKTIAIESSDDGSTWTTEASGISVAWDGQIHSISITPSVKRYWRVYNSQSTNSDRFAMYTLQFYNIAEGICENASAMSYIGLNNYASNTLLADSTWCSAIFESTYKESVLNVKVPIMTSNNIPSGVCGLYNTIMYGDNPPYYAFDGNSNTMARGNTGSNYGIIYYQFTSAKKCVGFELLSSNNLSFSEYDFVASNDGTNWDSLETYINDNTQSLVGHSKVNNTSYDYYGIKITKVKAGGTEYPYSSTGFDMQQLQFYGRADV